MNAIAMHDALGRLKNEQASAEGEVSPGMEQTEQAIIDYLPSVADSLVAQVTNMQNHRHLDGKSIHRCFIDRLCSWINCNAAFQGRSIGCSESSKRFVKLSRFAPIIQLTFWALSADPARW